MNQQLTLNIESETTPEDIQEMIQRTNEEELDSSPSVMPPPDIVAFNEQRSCADIFRMYQTKQIEISPDFQRGEVWGNSAQTLFIDSLMKQLPAVSTCKCTARKVKEYFRKNTQKGYENLIFLLGDGLFCQQLW